MNSKQKGLRALDDIFYYGLDYIKNNNLSLPIELVKTDESFLQQTFALYNIIEADKLTMLNCPKDSGITTALYFIMSYYSLTYPKILIFSKTGKARNQIMDKVFDLFKKFLDESYSQETQSNVVIISKGSTKISEIKFTNVTTFDINLDADILLFDDCDKIRNIDKYKDLMKNTDKHEKIIMNFMDSKDLATLAAENKINKKDFKIF